MSEQKTTNYTFTASELPVGSWVLHFRLESKIGLDDLKFLIEHPVEFSEIYEPIAKIKKLPVCRQTDCLSKMAGNEQGFMQVGK